ncbi:radical SAM protein [Nanoarchaeota archaeon]
MEINPDSVVWEYTLQCNSKCLHCGSNAKDKRENELSTEESLDLVDQIKDVGFKKIFLSGGEPTLRKDWIKIAERIKEHDIQLGIISNVLHWDDKTIDQISNLNPYSIGISIDGEPESHDYFRGVKGSHDKVFDTIKKLLRQDQTICPITSINNINFKELVQIRNRIIVYGTQAWQLQMASPMGRMKENKDLLIDEETYYKLAEFIVETRERLPYINVQAADCIGYFGVLEDRLRDSEWSGCGAGINGIGIESNGNVKGCLSIQHPDAYADNIRITTLKEIWEEKQNFNYTRNFTVKELGENCKKCDYGEQCQGGCSSQSVAFYDEFHNAPYCLYRMEENQNGKSNWKN